MLFDPSCMVVKNFHFFFCLKLLQKIRILINKSKQTWKIIRQKKSVQKASLLWSKNCKKTNGCRAWKMASLLN